MPKDFAVSVKETVKVVNPLKQGLKLRVPWIRYTLSPPTVKVVNPLKQGLKQLQSSSVNIKII